MAHTVVGYECHVCVWLVAVVFIQDPDFGFQVGTLTHEAGSLPCLHVYSCCLATARTETQKSYADDLMSDIPQTFQICSELIPPFRTMIRR